MSILLDNYSDISADLASLVSGQYHAESAALVSL